MNYKEYRGFIDATSEDVRSQLRSSNGIQYTETLFEETFNNRLANKDYKPLYSLKEHPTNDLPSSYQIYMASVDETEAALKLVGSLSHWKKLCSLRWFIFGRPEVGFEGLNSWRKDMWDRDKSAAKKVLMKLSSEGNVTAARALHKMASEDLITLSQLPKPNIGKGKDTDVADDFGFLDEIKGV